MHLLRPRKRRMKNSEWTAGMLQRPTLDRSKWENYRAWKMPEEKLRAFIAKSKPQPTQASLHKSRKSRSPTSKKRQQNVSGTTAGD